MVRWLHNSGALAHLVERFHGMEEVRSSNLLCSTTLGEVESKDSFLVLRLLSIYLTPCIWTLLKLTEVILLRDIKSLHFTS